MDMNLENLKNYKANFKSVIGTIHYLWVELDRGKGAGNKAGAQVKLSCLINNKDLFKKYVERLKENSYKTGIFSLYEKKSARIENYILDLVA